MVRCACSLSFSLLLVVLVAVVDCATAAAAVDLLVEDVVTVVDVVGADTSEPSRVKVLKFSTLIKLKQKVIFHKSIIFKAILSV